MSSLLLAVSAGTACLRGTSLLSMIGESGALLGAAQPFCQWPGVAFPWHVAVGQVRCDCGLGEDAWPGGRP
jgi:hypothetical protein